MDIVHIKLDILYTNSFLVSFFFSWAVFWTKLAVGLEAS